MLTHLNRPHEFRRFCGTRICIGVVAASLWACDSATNVEATAIEPESNSTSLQTVGIGSPPYDRSRTLGAFLDRYWQLPVPPQGPAPRSFAKGEESLDPMVCGACHPTQYREWKTSLHAQAFSPGLAGQLIEGDLSLPFALRQCQTCHTPLSEQQPFDASGLSSDSFLPAIRQQGVVCAACHVRAHQRFGPPRRAGLRAISGPLPHSGYFERAEFQQSRFCAPCHQFFDDPGVSGKPIENTFAEWQASPQAENGRSCQDCHMPDRAHTWRGIHNPEMVRSAVDAELFLTNLDADLADSANRNPTLGAALVLRNRNVGHMFPSYMTPRVVLAIWQEDSEAREVPDTRVEASLGRAVDLGNMEELSDTRVAPGEQVKLDYLQGRAANAATLVGRVTIDPDHHYRGLYEYLLGTPQSPVARGMIEEAYRRTLESVYSLYEIRRSLPGELD